MSSSITIPALKKLLVELIRIDEENIARLVELQDEPAAGELRTRQEAFKDALALAEGATLASVAQFDNLALADVPTTTPEAPT